MTYIHVNCDPHELVPPIKYARMWSDIKQSISPETYSMFAGDDTGPDDLPRFTPLKEVVVQYLVNVCQPDQDCIDDPQMNYFTLEIVLVRFFFLFFVLPLC